MLLTTTADGFNRGQVDTAFTQLAKQGLQGFGPHQWRRMNYTIAGVENTVLHAVFPGIVFVKIHRLLGDDLS